MRVQCRGGRPAAPPSGPVTTSSNTTTHPDDAILSHKKPTQHQPLVLTRAEGRRRGALRRRQHAPAERARLRRRVARGAAGVAGDRAQALQPAAALLGQRRARGQRAARDGRRRDGAHGCGGCHASCAVLLLRAPARRVCAVLSLLCAGVSALLATPSPQPPFTNTYKHMIANTRIHKKQQIRQDEPLLRCCEPDAVIFGAGTAGGGAVRLRVRFWGGRRLCDAAVKGGRTYAPPSAGHNSLVGPHPWFLFSTSLAAPLLPPSPTGPPG